MFGRSLLLASLAVFVATPAVAEIGRIKTTLGTANVERGADRMPAATGQQLMPGDWLETGKDGRITMTFVDNTRFAVGPDSRIALTKFEYDPTSQQGSFIAEVARGTVAVVSGRITKGGRDGMQIKTPDGDVVPHGTRFIIRVVAK